MHSCEMRPVKLSTWGWGQGGYLNIRLQAVATLYICIWNLLGIEEDVAASEDTQVVQQQACSSSGALLHLTP